MSHNKTGLIKAMNSAMGEMTNTNYIWANGRETRLLNKKLGINTIDGLNKFYKPI